ncbi:MAG: ABC transporter ATP-binding protein [Candidatus Rokuibacteriota bacterium]
MLRVEGVRAGYGGGPAVLHDVSFGLDAGDVLCLLGPNGSGKSTLLRCVLGLHRVTAGSIHVGGEDIAALSARQVARRLAYVPQATPAVFPFAAFDLVLMGRTAHLGFMASPTAGDRTTALAAMEELGMASLAPRPFHELSGGERQMVLIAPPRPQGSRVRVMDEPCAGLDYGNQMRILRTLRGLARRGYGVVMSSHLPDHAFMISSRVALLKRGRLTGPGAPAAIVTAAALSDLYGTDVRVLSVKVTEAPGGDLSLCVPVLRDEENSTDDALAMRALRDGDRAPDPDGGRRPGR